MTDEQQWTTEFYSREDGTSPVREFIARQDDLTQARFIAAIERLQRLNVYAREPLVKHIEGKLWELRQISKGNIYRLFYFFFTGQKIVFLHGFQKKSQKTPNREIKIAQQRMADYIRRKGGK
jgi:phage-related protein